MTPPVAMTIAGSDSGAGAGLQADLKAFAALGVYATTVVTAVTAQSTRAVTGVAPMSAAFVALQVETVLDDLPVAAVKTGMLASSEIVHAVAVLAGAGRLPNLVVDPVLVSSSGHPLLDPGGVDAYLHLLVPHARVLTPNLREAALLLGLGVEELGDVAAMTEAGRRLQGLGPATVVVKGGHLGGDTSPDVVVSAGAAHVHQRHRIRTANDHGTGCSLSAAIAAGLALGLEVDEAVGRAEDYVTGAIAGAAGWHLGAGRGPIDHFGWGERCT
jgi:hydroxymethylpyrimidine/phosphomethylpyrimidine kinase